MDVQTRSAMIVAIRKEHALRARHVLVQSLAHALDAGPWIPNLAPPACTTTAMGAIGAGIRRRQVLRRDRCQGHRMDTQWHYRISGHQSSRRTVVLQPFIVTPRPRGQPSMRKACSVRLSQSLIATRASSTITPMAAARSHRPLLMSTVQLKLLVGNGPRPL